MKTEEKEDLTLLLQKIQTEFEAINQSDLKEKSAFYSKNSCHIVVLEDKGFDVEKYKFTFDDKCILKTTLYEAFLKLDSFEKKHIFWRENQYDLTTINDINRLNRLLSTNDNSEKNKILWEQEDIDTANGIFKPVPQTPEQKSFVTKWEIDNKVNKFENENKDTILQYGISILSFDNYKKQFHEKVINTVSPKRFIEDCLADINKYINRWNNDHFNRKIPKNPAWQYWDYNEIEDKTTTIIDLIYSMANNNYTIDYALLYEYVHHSTMPTDYLHLSLLISPIQYKIFLEHQQEEISRLSPNIYIESLKDVQNDVVNDPEKIEFDNSKLSEIINDDLIEEFLQIEKRIKADGFITQKNTWKNGRGKNQTKTLHDLAFFIILLKSKRFLKSKIDGKKINPNDYRRFFEKRYSCVIKEQFSKARKNEDKSLENAKTIFYYV